MSNFLQLYFPTRPKIAVLLEYLILPLDRLFNRLYSYRFNPIYQSGTIALLFLMVTIVTGLYQLFFYQIATPWDSVTGLESQWWAGRWIRAVHSYAGDGIIVAVTFHVLRMLMQGKTWGARVLAWISGVVMTGILFLSAWTGIVLVWDQQAKIVAVEGARILDMLPLFSEPIQRSFTGAEDIPSTFFFLNLLLHMVFPIGVLMLFWMHTLRLARPVWFPPRRMTLWLLGGLLALGLARPLGMMPRAEAMSMLGEASVDMLYVWWLPVNALWGPQGTLLLWAALGLAAFTAPWWWRPKLREMAKPSLVNEAICTGCTQCYKDCPYEAITMVAAPPGVASKDVVARVDPALCTSCGVCAGSCAPMVIGPPKRAGRDLVMEVQVLYREESPGADSLVVFACNQGLAGAVAQAGLEGVHVNPVHCTGALHTFGMEYLLRRGVGGIYLLGCPPRDCTYREGVRWAAERVFNNREAELKDRVDKSRVRMASFGRGEAREALREIAAFREELRILSGAVDEGEVDLDLECNTALAEEIAEMAKKAEASDD